MHVPPSVPAAPAAERERGRSTDAAPAAAEEFRVLLNEPARMPSRRRAESDAGRDAEAPTPAAAPAQAATEEGTAAIPMRDPARTDAATSESAADTGAADTGSADANANGPAAGSENTVGSPETAPDPQQQADAAALLLLFAVPHEPVVLPLHLEAPAQIPALTWRTTVDALRTPGAAASGMPAAAHGDAGAPAVLSALFPPEPALTQALSSAADAGEPALVAEQGSAVLAGMGSTTTVLAPGTSAVASPHAATLPQVSASAEGAVVQSAPASPHVALVQTGSVPAAPAQAASVQTSTLRPTGVPARELGKNPALPEAALEALVPDADPASLVPALPASQDGPVASAFPAAQAPSAMQTPASAVAAAADQPAASPLAHAEGAPGLATAPFGATPSPLAATAAPQGSGTASAPPNPLERAIAHQVGRTLHQLRGSDAPGITLRLTPPELGTVRIEIRSENGHLHARIHAEDPAVRDAIDKMLPTLRSELRGHEAGIRELSLAEQRTTSSRDRQDGERERDERDQSRDQPREHARDGAQREQPGSQQRPRRDAPRFSLSGLTPAPAAVAPLPAPPAVLGGRAGPSGVDARA